MAEKFPRNFRDNLRFSSRGLIIAAAGVAVLFLLLVVLYTAFDLGAMFPKRHP